MYVFKPYGWGWAGRRVLERRSCSSGKHRRSRLVDSSVEIDRLTDPTFGRKWCTHLFSVDVFVYAARISLVQIWREKRQRP